MSDDEAIKAIVEKILKEDKRSRTDAKWLTYKVMRHFTKIFIPYKDFEKIPSFESIAKYKRDFQNRENKYNEKFTPEEGVTYHPPVKNEINL